MIHIALRIRAAGVVSPSNHSDYVTDEKSDERVGQTGADKTTGCFVSQPLIQTGCGSAHAREGDSVPKWVSRM